MALASQLRRVSARKDGRGARWPNKQPAELLDYAIDWTARLDAGDTIKASAFVVPDGLEATSSSRGDRDAVVWLGAGDDRVSYLIVNRITTTAGRELRQVVRLKIRAKSRA